MMPSMAYHPRAYLSLKRNVRPGLATRTKILSALEERPGLTVSELSELTGLSSSAIRKQLISLEEEGIVARRGKRPFKWTLTGLGQARLTEFWRSPSGVR